MRCGTFVTRALESHDVRALIVSAGLKGQHRDPSHAIESVTASLLLLGVCALMLWVLDHEQLFRSGASNEKKTCGEDALWWRHALALIVSFRPHHWHADGSNIPQSKTGLLMCVRVPLSISTPSTKMDDGKSTCFSFGFPSFVNDFHIARYDERSCKRIVRCAIHRH